VAISRNIHLAFLLPHRTRLFVQLDGLDTQLRFHIGNKLVVGGYEKLLLRYPMNDTGGASLPLLKLSIEVFLIN
jgi:hypothetical protein